MDNQTENQPSISSDLIRGHIDTIILHTLIESDKFAQQISDAVESNSDNAYKINQATLYSSLKRLESLKLVSSYWHDFEGGRRKFFKITDYGKKTVDENLSSWVYSRSIIDKLMNIVPSAPPAFSVQNKTVEAVDSSVVTQKPLLKVQETDKSVKTENQSENVSVKPDNNEFSFNSGNRNTEQERNFRTILDGLMKLSVEQQKQQENVNIEPIITVSGENSKPELQKFNETIDETDYNANKANFNNKIDYGDLTLKAEKEGYNLRISSKDSAKPVGKVLINRLNFAVSAIIFALCLIELAALYLAFKDAFGYGAVIALSFLSVVSPLFFAVKFFIAKNKLISKKITADGILISAIVVFNLILLNFAFDFLLELDLSDAPTLLAALIIPLIYYIDAVLFFALRFCIYSRKRFLYK